MAFEIRVSLVAHCEKGACKDEQNWGKVYQYHGKTRNQVIEYARLDGWSQVKGAWLCPKCSKPKVKVQPREVTA